MWLEKTSQGLPLNQFGQDLEDLVAYLTKTYAFSIHREKSKVTSN